MVTHITRDVPVVVAMRNKKIFEDPCKKKKKELWLIVLNVHL